MTTMLFKAAFGMSLLVLVSCGTTSHRTTHSSRQPVAGHFIRGGTSEHGSTRLELQQDGSYIATQTGCMGVYGEERGSWRLVDSQISLSVTSNSGWSLPRLQQLQVQHHNGKLILVDTKDAVAFRERPTDEYSYFRRSK